MVRNTENFFAFLRLW